MKLAIRYRKSNLNTALVVLFFNAILLALLFITDHPFFILLLIGLGFLFTFHQLFKIGYKLEKKDIDQQNIERLTAQNNTILILYSFRFLEKTILEKDGDTLFIYNESKIMEDVFSTFSVFRLVNLKEKLNKINQA